MPRRSIARAALLPLAAGLLAACSGGAGEPATVAADTPAVRKVWTPEDARALREERARADSVPPAAVIPVPGPSEGEDSAAWAAEEKQKYDQRVSSMQSYADCMARARGSDAALRPTIEAACRRLPTAPKG